MTAAQIRDAARLAGADATAENVLSRTGEVAEVWVAGFIAALEAARSASGPPEYQTRLLVIDRLLVEAHLAAEDVGTP